MPQSLRRVKRGRRDGFAGGQKPGRRDGALAGIFVEGIRYVLYIQHMLNLSNTPSVEDRRRVIEDFGGYFAQSGVPPTAGRIWGYLLLSREPVSIDRIAADLGMSKSSVSVGTRQLEQFMLARRSGEPGSRRALYEASRTGGRFFEQLLTSYRTVARVIDAAVGVSPDETVRARLEEMSRFFHLWIDEFTQLANRLEESRR